MQRPWLAIVLGMVWLLLVGCGEGQPGATPAPAADPISAFKAAHPRVGAAAGDPGAGPGAGAGAVSVTVVTADRVATLDPHNTESGGDVKVINQIYQTLLRIDPHDVDRLVPELAEGWTVSEDGLTLTFGLRPGVVFHDGGALDAEAAKLSLERLRGAYLDVPAAPYRGFYDFIESIERGGMTLRVRLNRPVARIALRNLSMFPASIVSPVLLRATAGMNGGELSAFISEWASGTGPFYLGQLDSAEGRVRLAAFAGYWGGPPSIAKVLFRHVADPNSQIEYLRAGEADMLDDAPRAMWDELERSPGEPGVELHRWWALNVAYLGLNVRHEKTSDRRVREAIRLAIDPAALVELYYGSARPTYSLVAQPMAEYDPEYRAPGLEDPPAARRLRAQRLLEGAGASGRSLRIYYPMNPRPYLPTPDKIADKLRQQLRQIGLDVEIVAIPNKELFDKIKTDQYELVLIGWMSDNADADNFYVPLADGDPTTGEPAPTNVGRAFDPAIHEALMRAQAITDVAERVAAYRQIEQDLQERILGYVPLVNTQQAMALRAELRGVEIDALGHYRFAGARLGPKADAETR